MWLPLVLYIILLGVATVGFIAAAHCHTLPGQIDAFDTALVSQQINAVITDTTNHGSCSLRFRVLLVQKISSLSSGKGEDLLGKSNVDAADDSQHTIGPLEEVVALEGQAQLKNAEAQRDQADGTDHGEDEIVQVLYEPV